MVPGGTTLITRERALEAIGAERLAQLRGVQRDGWAEWEAIRATQQGATLSTSARARIVYDATVRRALETFPSSSMTKHHGLLLVDLGEVLARFKKVTDEFEPRGIPTGQATLLEEQGHLGTLLQMPLWPPKPMLIVGYVVDALGMTIRRQALVLRRSGRVMWWHDLSSDDGAVTVPVSIGPAPTGTPAPAVVRSARAQQEARKEAE